MDKFSSSEERSDLHKKKGYQTNSETMGNNDDFKKVKFEIYGEEMIEKIVKVSGNSGRIYLPPDWVGHSVKVVRVD